LADRVTFAIADASGSGVCGQYDLVTIFEGLHDISRPVDALRLARGMLREPGCVIVADELVEDEFTAPASAEEQYHYAWSVVACLPAVMGDPDTAATGAVMRPATPAPVRLGSRLPGPGSPPGQGGNAALLPTDTMTSCPGAVSQAPGRHIDHARARADRPIRCSAGGIPGTVQPRRIAVGRRALSPTFCVTQRDVVPAVAAESGFIRPGDPSPAQVAALRPGTGT